ncbi:HAD-IC family P-type ATPase [Ruicaihuangia caeni]|uniref:HAD-IC family P-type ATPase n=1 Tax=Ruicaihuangia caeni TaxID=3042517 RepID=A0AAW6T6C8_9MICO|nr:HAD-IC family P-type ATPase [Klugiella sp. YN-L-19]MDI2097645.1 HAD-IC family P-type ATPase [Klugiella sp. YN-L-19]
MPDDSVRSILRIFSSNVLTVFNAVVGGCFLLLLVLGAWQDALFGFFVLANTGIGLAQELRARHTLNRLAVLNAPRALARRNGEDVECRVADVVLDDLLVLRPGEQLVADAVVVESQGLEVDESALTGEANPVLAAAGRELLSGAVIVGGAGLARVVRLGTESYAWRITAEARRFSLVDSELRQSIARVIRWVSLALIPFGAVIVNGQMQAAGGWQSAFSSGAWRDAAVAAVASIIAMVPAGLVFMTSVALAVGAARLARRRVLMHELAAVEILARVDALCIDKTGTLTDGSLVLDRVETLGDGVEGWRSALAWFSSDLAANATTLAIGTAFSSEPDAAPSYTVPFSSRHKWSGAHFSHGPAGTWVLGGADVLLSRLGAPGDVEERAASMAVSSRTLLLAHSLEPLPDREDGKAPDLPRTLTPVALLALRERVRPDAAETIRYFAEQGVQLYVISGDDPRTVAAVAAEAGIQGHLVGVDARTLPSDPTLLQETLRTERIFGRVTPEQKRAMVLALQSLGRTVAMTGDGVNDALALKRADLAIAMGTGTPAARAVANVVLLDDQFTSLPEVVAEGRRVIWNVERLAKLFLSKTVYAIMLGVAFGALLLPFPFLPRQLSVVDGLTIGLPAIALALLPDAPVYRRGFLGRAARFCIPSGIIVGAAVIAASGYSFATGVPAAEVRTTAVITLTLSALWVLVVLARPFTVLTASIVVGAYAGLVLVLMIPFAWRFLELAQPPADALAVGIGTAAAASVCLEIVHRTLRRRPARSSSPSRRDAARVPPLRRRRR